MRLNRVYLMLKKECKHLMRNKRVLGIVLLMPILMVIIIGYAFSGDVKNIPTVVVDESKGELSAKILEALQSTDVLRIRYYANSRDEAEQLITEGRAKAIILLPSGLERDAMGQAGFVYLLVDGSDPTSANSAFTAVQSVIQGLNGGVMIRMSTITLFNPTLKYVDYLVPGAVDLILQMLPTLLVTFAISGEREKGTIEQLMVTPIASSEILVGKMLLYILLGFIEATSMLTVAVVIFHVTIRGNYIVIAALILLFVSASVSLGSLLSVFARNQVQAVQQVYPLIILSVFLSGVFYPLEAMPDFIRPFSGIIPLTYMNRAIRAVMIKGAPLVTVSQDILVLVVYAATLVILAVRAFKRGVE
jgi:ABC-2 type transport system permease protein